MKFFIASRGTVRFFDEDDQLIAERSFINEDDGRIIVSNNAQYVVVLNYLTKSISLRDIDNKQIWQHPLPTRLFRRGRSVGTQPILTAHGLFIDPLTIISIIDKSGEIVRQFANDKFGERLNAEALSIDGRFFAFTSVREERAHLYLADILQDGAIAWHYSGADEGIKRISSVSIANAAQIVAAVCWTDVPYQPYLIIWDKDGKILYQRTVKRLSYSKISSDGANLWVATTERKLYLYEINLLRPN